MEQQNENKQKDSEVRPFDAFVIRLKNWIDGFLRNNEDEKVLEFYSLEILEFQAKLMLDDPEWTVKKPVRVSGLLRPRYRIVFRKRNDEELKKEKKRRERINKCRRWAHNT